MKKWIRKKLRKFLKYEDYLKDDFDEQHLKWVYAGITTIEQHEEIKKYYFDKKIYEISDKKTDFDKQYSFTKDIGLVTKEQYDEIKDFYYGKLRRFQFP
tara:strand:+ start:169 stop:465 length:297 start_codon:yes stop_codon:yes gene_type:complete